MKSYLKYFIVLIISVVSLGCKREETPDPLVGAFIQSILDLRVTSQSGADLLDPSNPKALKKFIVSYLFNGEKKSYPARFGDNSGGYRIERYPMDSFYRLKVFITNPWEQDSIEPEYTTYLEFEDGSIDTIRAIFEERPPGCLFVVKASYNNKPAWDYYKNNGNTGVYEVIKP